MVTASMAAMDAAPNRQARPIRRADSLDDHQHRVMICSLMHINANTYCPHFGMRVRFRPPHQEGLCRSRGGGTVFFGGG